MVRPCLHDEVQAVEGPQADVGNEKVERTGGQQPFRGVVCRRARHVMSGIPEQFDDAGQRVLVVIEDEYSIG